MGRVDIGEEPADNLGFDKNLIIEDQDWNKTPRIQLQEIGWARPIHINYSLFEWQSQFSKGDVGSIGPYITLENAQ